MVAETPVFSRSADKKAWERAWTIMKTGTADRRTRVRNQERLSAKQCMLRDIELTFRKRSHSNIVCFSIERRNGSTTKKNGTRGMKDAEPSEFGHKVWKSPALNGSGHCCSHFAGLQQPGAGRTEPYPLWRGSEFVERQWVGRNRWKLGRRRWSWKA